MVTLTYGIWQDNKERADNYTPEFREFLGIKAGEKVLFDLEDEIVVLKKAPQNPVADLVGLGKGIFGEGLEYQRKIRSEWKDK